MYYVFVIFLYTLFLVVFQVCSTIEIRSIFTHAQYKVLLVWFNNMYIPIPKFAQKGIYKLCLIILLRSFCRNCFFSPFSFPAITISLFPPSLCWSKVLINFCYNKKNTMLTLLIRWRSSSKVQLCVKEDQFKYPSFSRLLWFGFRWFTWKKIK